MQNRRLLPLPLATLLVVLAGCANVGVEPDRGAPNPGAQSSALGELCVLAEEESGPVIWYESSPPEQSDEILAAFNASFPKIAVEHVRIAGGASIAAQVIQESQFNARTADMVTGAVVQIVELAGRDLVADLDATKMGITNEDLMPVPYAMATTASVPVIAYNTDQVDAEDAPQTWEDLLDPKWSGKMGAYASQGNFFANLVPEWGETKTDEYVKAWAATGPILSESTFSLSQNVGAGALAIGLSLYHTTKDVMNTGAPVDFIIPEPVPISILYSSMVTSSPNPLSTQCFIGWLGSEEGALAYEDGTSRGNYLVPSTNTYALLQGKKKVSQLGFDDPERQAELTKKYNTMIAQ